MATENWHLDKRVPISLITALLIQAGSFVWAVSQLNFQVADHEKRIGSVEETDKRRNNELYGFNDRLARLEENSKSQIETLRRIENLLK